MRNIKLSRTGIKNVSTKKIILYIFICFAIFSIGIRAQAEDEVYSNKVLADIITFSFTDSGDVVEVTGTGNASMVYNDYQITAGFIKFNKLNDNILIKENVIFDNGEYILKAAEVNGNLANQEFKATENVKLESDELNITSNELNFLEQKGEMTFSGKVHLLYKGIEALADRVVYDSNKQTALLEGNVTGENGKIKMSGERLEIDLENGSFRLLGQDKPAVVSI